MKCWAEALHQVIHVEVVVAGKSILDQNFLYSSNNSGSGLDSS